MSEDRPIEPCSASEGPEEWAEIAYWEGERADEAEATIKAQAQEIEELKKYKYGCGNVLVEMSKAAYMQAQEIERLSALVKMDTDEVDAKDVEIERLRSAIAFSVENSGDPGLEWCAGKDHEDQFIINEFIEHNE